MTLHAFQAEICSRIPDSYPPKPDGNEGAKFAHSKRFHCSTEKEISYLRKLTEAGCPAAPKLIAVRQDIQHQPLLKAGYSGEESIWVPGGYIIYILMEKLPGQDLSDFFLPQNFTLQEREEVREAFCKAFTYICTTNQNGHFAEIYNSVVETCGVLPKDSRLSNIIWDKTSKRW